MPIEKFRLDILYTDLKRIYRVLPKNLQKKVILLFSFMTLLGIIELASILALTFFFTTLGAPQNYISMPIVQKFVSKFPFLNFIVADERFFVLVICLFPISLIILKNFLMGLVAWRSAILGELVAAHVGASIMQRFLRMPYSWHLSPQSSRAMTAMQWRFNLGQMLLQIMTAISNLITVFLLFMGMAIYDPQVTLSAVCYMLIISLVTYKLLGKKIDNATQKAAQATHEENAASMTAMGAVRELIIYQKQDVFLNVIQKWINAGMKPRSFLGLSSAVPAWTLESAGFFLIWFTIFFFTIAKNETLSAITAAVALISLTAWRVLPSMNRMVGATVSLRALKGTAIPCLDYYEELGKLSPINDNKPDPFFKINCEIIFDHVSYRYPNEEQYAIFDICCTIPVGSSIALVGRSGAGKSTFINLLSGLLEPTSGRILIDGREMNVNEIASFRAMIGYVPQNPYIIGGSIAQNIAFCDWGGEINKTKVKSACKNAAIDFLGHDYKDIDRCINHASLSGGQIQRISIARAFYSEPAILIFDEATSALDNVNESIIQETVKKCKGKMICVMAAHRLSTLDVCDIAIWLDNGKLYKKGEAKIVIDEYNRATTL